MRHLIASLERENINLAHVWPKTYPGMKEETAKTTCYWFVGLVVGNSANGHLDLTSPIKNFTDIVMRSAIQINVWKTGMRIEAYYRKRKLLAPYLPASEHWKLKSERKSSVAVTAAASPSSNGSSSATKRSPPTEEEAVSPHPTKKMNSGSSVDMEDTDFSKLAPDITPASVEEQTPPAQNSGIEAIVS